MRGGGKSFHYFHGEAQTEIRKNFPFDCPRVDCFPIQQQKPFRLPLVHCAPMNDAFLARENERNFTKGISWSVLHLNCKFTCLGPSSRAPPTPRSIIRFGLLSGRLQMICLQPGRKYISRVKTWNGFKCPSTLPWMQCSYVSSKTFLLPFRTSKNRPRQINSQWNVSSEMLEACKLHLSRSTSFLLLVVHLTGVEELKLKMRRSVGLRKKSHMLVKYSDGEL